MQLVGGFRPNTDCVAVASPLSRRLARKQIFLSKVQDFSLIPFLCEAAYNSPPCSPPDALGGLQGGIVMCIFIQNWYKLQK